MLTSPSRMIRHITKKCGSAQLVRFGHNAGISRRQRVESPRYSTSLWQIGRHSYPIINRALSHFCDCKLVMGEIEYHSPPTGVINTSKYARYSRNCRGARPRPTRHIPFSSIYWQLDSVPSVSLSTIPV